MPDYRRAYEPGGTFFFTVVTHQRRRVFAGRGAVDLFRAALAEVRRRWPFDVLAGVVLPDHVHCIWRLPEDDTDFSMRWRLIKMSFTRTWLATGGGEGPRGDRRLRKGERGVWQHRFWEHTIRSGREFQTLCDYIHYNRSSMAMRAARMHGRTRHSRASWPTMCIRLTGVAFVKMPGDNGRCRRSART